jgi:hypothetical protein
MQARENQIFDRDFAVGDSLLEAVIEAICNL